METQLSGRVEGGDGSAGVEAGAEVEIGGEAAVTEPLPVAAGSAGRNGAVSPLPRSHLLTVRRKSCASRENSTTSD
jgi:hypothetical protein